jgi:uncharacterized protein (AIM24 family)
MPFLEEKYAIHTVVPMKDAGGSWEVIGDLSNVVHITMEPGQEIQTEPGVWIYGSDKCRQKIKLGGIARMLTQGTLAKSVYKNNSSLPGFIGISSNFPGTVIPFNLDEMGGSVGCKHGCFLGAIDPNATIGLQFLNTDSFLACCCAGVSPILERIQAKGWVFIAAHGTIVTKDLKDNEEIAVDSDAIVAVTSNVKVDVERTGTCSGVCCGGEGLFNTTLKGPGKVYLTSMSIDKIKRLFAQPVSKKMIEDKK